MINAYSSTVDRSAFQGCCSCFSNADFKVIQDIGFIFAFANAAVCSLIYANLVGYPFFGIVHESKPRAYQPMSYSEWSSTEAGSTYNFKTTLFDVVLLLVAKAFIVSLVWITSGCTSFTPRPRPTISIWCRFIEYLCYLVVIALAAKIAMFDFKLYIMDTDDSGEPVTDDDSPSDDDGTGNVGDWINADGEIVAAHDWSYDHVKNSSLSLQIIAITLTVVEGLMHRQANSIETKMRRFMVHPDRCPQCTRPIGTCQHTAQNKYNLKVMSNWHYDFFGCCEAFALTLKVTCCCCFPCVEGEIVAIENPSVDCGIATAAYCLLTCMCPVGLHAILGGCQRNGIRRRNRIGGTFFRDVVTHWCCCWCAIIQERRQLDVEHQARESERKARKAQRSNNDETTSTSIKLPSWSKKKKEQEMNDDTRDDQVGSEEEKVDLEGGNMTKIVVGAYEGSIVSHRRRMGGNLEYRVHWKGKSNQDDDWFTRDELIDEYPDVLVNYERTAGDL